MSFKADLNSDLHEVFFNTEEFGEVVTLTRGKDSVAMRGLFDSPGVSGEQLGGEVEAISHAPRLFVRSVDLPNGKPAKGDVFELIANDLHAARKLRAVDYVFEQDGTVVYRLIDCK